MRQRESSTDINKPNSQATTEMEVLKGEGQRASDWRVLETFADIVADFSLTRRVKSARVVGFRTNPKGQGWWTLPFSQMLFFLFIPHNIH
jgi:hypothetical protein